MRILVFHNFYRSTRPSGENNAVLSDVEALQTAGHDVLLARKDSDAALDAGPLGKLRSAAGAVYSIESKHDTRDLIRSFKPSIAHSHNLNPLWSPAVADALSQADVPRIQVLHNYRLSCMNGSHMLDGQPCFRCLGATVGVAGIVHRCYNGSLAGSAVMAASHAVNEGRLLGADWYLAVSSIVKERALQQGVRKDRISIKPEYLRVDGREPRSAGDYFLFVGRLDANKGCLLLLDAYGAYRRQSGSLPLRIVGSGPLEQQVRTLAASIGGVQVLGQLPPSAARNEIVGARAVVSPALWAEPFGLTVLEAWREGRPVIVTNIGGPAEMVTPQSGWLVPPEGPMLTNALKEAEEPSSAHRRGLRGRTLLKERFSADATLHAYEEAWTKLHLREL